MRRSVTALALAATLGLSACGSSSGADDPGTLGSTAARADTAPPLGGSTGPDPTGPDFSGPPASDADRAAPRQPWTRPDEAPAVQSGRLTPPIPLGSILGPPAVPQPIAGTVTSRCPSQAEYVPNPGMGYMEFGDSNPDFGQTILSRRGPYWGYDWASMNPAPGVYDFSRVYADLARAQAVGKQVTMRIQTHSGEGHRVPRWALAEGALLHSSSGRADEPIYHSTVYQKRWGEFVDALAATFDGHPGIAWIDISGYGKYNEWQDYPLTVRAYEDPMGPVATLDGMARRHLVQMFTGGAGTIDSLGPDGVTVESLAYDHTGFQRTQLVMPYGGQHNSTRYVLANHPDVGLRADSLGLIQMATFDRLGYGVKDLWQRAPVVFESISRGIVPDPDMDQIAEVAKEMHASVVVDLNDDMYRRHHDDFESAVLGHVGYRYACTSATLPAGPVADSMAIDLVMRNEGWGRAYPRMGQDYRLHLAVSDSAGAIVETWALDEDVSSWSSQTDQAVTATVPVDDLAAGQYTVLLSVASSTTGARINLAQAGGRSDRWYPVGVVSIAQQGR